jgi:signal transduction histidine kinase
MIGSMFKVRASAARRQEWLEFWEQRELSLLEGLPYVMLVVATALDVAARGGFTSAALIDIGLGVISAGWMLFFVTLHPGWVQRKRLMAVFFVGLVALMAVLVIRSPVYGFYTFTGYFWVYRVVEGWWRVPALAAVALMSALSQTGGGPYNSAGKVAVLVVVFLVNAGVAGGVSWFGWVGDAQKQRRQRMIAELTEANAKLEATLRENADLHEQLLAQAREAGISEERQRMSREIHDTIAQGLAGIITQLQAAEQAGADRHAGARHLEAAVELARESLSEARRSVQALRPEALEVARLPDAVRDVAERWSALHDVPVAVTTTGAARVMRPEIEVALLRTAQEALANVAKHARATRVGLTLSYMEDLVTLDVRDDGVGFMPGSGPARPERAGAHGPGGPDANGHGTPSGGYGLDAMRQRVEGVAGTLEIESEPRGGTAISASVPAVPAAGGR